MKMKSKILLPLILIILITFTSIVSANMNILQEFTTGNKYGVDVHIEKGWNIITGLGGVREISSDSEIKKDDIIAIWYYSPIKKSYLNMHPTMDENEFIQDISYYGDDPILTSAKWIYSRKSGVIKYSTSRIDNLNKRKLVAGWNFVGITPEMAEDFVGSCDVQKAYFWDIANMDWKAFPVSNPQDFTWDGDSIFGYGLVIKVTNDCNLALSGESLTQPPTLPT
jgi:hypothetical protein